MRMLEIGSKHGRLTVASFSGYQVKPSGQRLALYCCQCECGNITTTTAERIQTGRTRSCGCLGRDTTGARSTKHGHAKRTDPSPTYRTWKCMIQRCCDQNCKSYVRYGAVGISVCDEWRNSFDEFLKDMGEKPGQSYSIDRVNNALGYSRENCRWATREQQAQNKSTTVMIEIGGEKKPLNHWARDTGVSVGAIKRRMKLGYRGHDLILNGRHLT